ncbi:MAG: helix-turn-helix domain-containing protein [Clostridiaceae bacterium]|jgi:transcriptional regulator with XRE-family HTH domain|nr:helix-turn-helix domain-containing protein [Clostridiaceae bacterium]
MKTLAQFVQKKRDGLGLSTKGLAERCHLPLNTLEDIEAGKELFLATTIRQKLAKGLRCSLEEIKELEKDFSTMMVSEQIIESLKELILKGSGGLKCPVCGAALVTRIAKMYDLEDNLVLEAKAHCSKCSFQIHS